MPATREPVQINMNPCKPLAMFKTSFVEKSCILNEMYPPSALIGIFVHKLLFHFVYAYIEDCRTICNLKKMNRKLVLYIATSLDGYIAKPQDDIGFLSAVAQEGQDYGYAEFLEGVDAVILGRKTYDIIVSMGIEFPHSDKDSYVITRSARPATGSVKFYSGELKSLVQQLKSQKGKNIYCDGGAEIANELIRHDLIDEFIISVIPVLVGDGIRLFKDHRPEQLIELLDVKSFDTGLVQLHYRRNKNS